jgi:hypothetical protein
MVKTPHEHSGLGATLIALLILAGALTVIGIVVWLRTAPSGAPTQPAQVTKPSSELRVPLESPVVREYLARSAVRSAML